MFHCLHDSVLSFMILDVQHSPNAKFEGNRDNVFTVDVFPDRPLSRQGRLGRSVPICSLASPPFLRWLDLNRHHSG